MKKLLMILLTALMIVACFGLAFADEKSHRAAADEFLMLLQMENVLAQSIDQMLAIEMQGNPQLKIYEGVLKEFFSKYMSWDSLKDDLAMIYMEEFTQGELLEIAAFYKTSTGQKAIKKMPVLMQKGALLGHRQLNHKFVPKLD